MNLIKSLIPFEKIFKNPLNSFFNNQALKITDFKNFRNIGVGSYCEVRYKHVLIYFIRLYVRVTRAFHRLNLYLRSLRRRNYVQRKHFKST